MTGSRVADAGHPRHSAKLSLRASRPSRAILRRMRASSTASCLTRYARMTDSLTSTSRMTLSSVESRAWKTSRSMSGARAAATRAAASEAGVKSIGTSARR